MQKRFNFPKDTVELYAEKVANRGLCAVAQAESLRYKLLGGLAVRRWVANVKVEVKRRCEEAVPVLGTRSKCVVITHCSSWQWGSAGAMDGGGRQPAV